MIAAKRIQSATELKRRVWEILDIAKPNDVASKVFNTFILTLIFLNVIAVILSTVKPIEESYERLFYWFEVFSVTVFSLEYLARIWACAALKEYSNPIWGRLRFAFKPMSLIDLLAVLPFFLTFVQTDLRFIRILRLFRIFRVAKLVRYSSSIRLIGRVFKNKKEELVITAMVLMLLIVVTASFMYFAENEAQPDRFPDIPSTMWWSVVTLTTVGYGDVYPITGLGKFLASIISVLGIGMGALPTGILAVSFVEEIQKQKSRKVVCPHCEKEIE